jgi:hypothetical protein
MMSSRPAVSDRRPQAAVRQPFTAPASRSDERAWREAGLLLDTAGCSLPASPPPCGFCDGADLGDTCPAALTCPSCGAGPGRHCQRPSEWETYSWHVARVQAAELEDQRREDAGATDLPARWATTPGSTANSRGAADRRDGPEVQAPLWTLQYNH